MIRWSARQIGPFQYSFQIEDEYYHPIFTQSDISSPAFSILTEILMDYKFAISINKFNTMLKFQDLNSDDRMDLSIISLYKIEDADDDT